MFILSWMCYILSIISKARKEVANACRKTESWYGKEKR